MNATLTAPTHPIARAFGAYADWAHEHGNDRKAAAIDERLEHVAVVYLNSLEESVAAVLDREYPAGAGAETVARWRRESLATAALAVVAKWQELRGATRAKL